MEEVTTIEDNISIRSGSIGGRSPPPLSPIVSAPSNASSSPPPSMFPVPYMPASLSGMHGTAAGLFSVASPHRGHPPFLSSLYFNHSYTSPPPIHTSDPTANDCKLIEFKGQKIAAFMINGNEMLCLPQAFELFLKNLVGGLHTVYTKLKRLGIEPLVCNVEQVRVLRGLGAIQPGVNRCKLLCLKHFELLYKDCTTARRRDRLSSLLHDRPGRPPKRPHEITGFSMGTHLPHAALASHITPETLLALKKARMEGREFSHGIINGGQTVPESDLEKSPLLSNGYNPPPKTLVAQYMAMNGGLPHPALFPPTGIPLPPPGGNLWQPHPSQEQAFKINTTQSQENLTRIQDDRTRTDRALGLQRDNQRNRDYLEESENNNSMKQNDEFNDSSVLNLSKSESRDYPSDSEQGNNSDTQGSPVEVNEKMESISDNEDFDKNEMSDVDDYDSSVVQNLPPLIRNKDPDNISAIAPNATNLLNNPSRNDHNQTRLGNITISKNLTERTLSNESSESANEGQRNNVDLLEMSERNHRELNLGGNLLNLRMGLVGTHGLNNLTNGLTLPPAATADREMRINSSISPTSAIPLGVATYPPLSSLENLLGNIQNLLKVAAESVRHEEKQWSREMEHLRLEFNRQKELREKLEKQLEKDDKIKMIYLRKLKREKRARRKIEEELSEKLSRLSQYENDHNKSSVADGKPPIPTTQLPTKVKVVSNINQPNILPHLSTTSPSSNYSGSRIGPTNFIDNYSTISPHVHNNNLENNVKENSPKSEDKSSLYYNKSMMFNCKV